MITINELTDELVSMGYKIGPSTIKFYLGIDGLLPKPEKQGKYREGVKLVFPDKNEVLSRLVTIYSLKGRGFSLSEIKQEIFKIEKKGRIENHKAGLSKYIEIDGKFYMDISEVTPVSIDANYFFGDNLYEFEQDQYASKLMEREIQHLRPIHRSHYEEMQKRQLYQGLFFINGKIAHEKSQISDICKWIILRLDYDIEWPILEAILNKHLHNIELFFPVPDGVRFTREYVEWYKRYELNGFPGLLLGYFNSMRKNFINYNGFEHEVSCKPDSNYDDINLMIEDFLNGKCAFIMPAPSIGNEFYLRRFY